MNEALAITRNYLQKHSIYQHEFADRSLLFLTDNSGATRVYETNGKQFTNSKFTDKLKSSDGITWKLTEDFLIDESGTKLQRLVANQSFWFAWFAMHPRTILIK